MGRKANLKRIKRIAKTMPEVNRLDHNRNMVERYNKAGAKGVAEYMEFISNQIPFVPKERRLNMEV